MIAYRARCVILGSLLLVAACGGDGDDAGTGAVPAATDTVPMGEMGDRSGMDGMSDMQDGMMDQMMTHMQGMRAAGADSMRAMLPMHRQMVANMIARMNREMRDMGMERQSDWNAIIDSLRSDLTRMPEMNQDEMHAMMPGHHDRVMRLMEMHRAMMREMNM